MTILFSRIIPREQFLVVHASIRHIENTIAARAPTPTGTPWNLAETAALNSRRVPSEEAS